MIDVILPDLPERELALASQGNRHTTDASTPPLPGQVRLGGPLAVPVTTELVAADPELKAFVTAESAHAVYHLLHFSLTCATTAPDPTLHTVNLDLTLTAEAGAAFRPVAWSMTPHALTETHNTTARAQLGPRLDFAGHEPTLTRGRRSCLEALRELRSDPGWEIRRTRTVPIDGTYRTAMVVRAPRGAVSLATIGVGACVRARDHLRRFRAEIPEPITLPVRS